MTSVQKRSEARASEKAMERRSVPKALEPEHKSGNKARRKYRATKPRAKRANDHPVIGK